MAIVKNVTVLKTFKDGSLSTIFSRLGYPIEWKAGERRDLPEDVLRHVILSGAQISFDATAKESAVTHETPSIDVDAKAIAEKAYTKAKKTRVMFPEGFRDGSFADELAALNHPPTFEPGEIIELPTAVLEKITNSGGLFTTNQEEIDQFINYQLKHAVRIEQWRKDQEQQKARNEANQASAAKNASTMAELEELSKDYIEAKGAFKDAIWTRIVELKGRLQ